MLFAASIDLEYVSGHSEMHIAQKTTSKRKGLLKQQTSRTQHYDQTKPELSNESAAWCSVPGNINNSPEFGCMKTVEGRGWRHATSE